MEFLPSNQDLLVFERIYGGEKALAIFNFGAEHQALPAIAENYDTSLISANVTPQTIGAYGFILKAQTG